MYENETGREKLSQRVADDVENRGRVLGELFDVSPVDGCPFAEHVQELYVLQVSPLVKMLSYLFQLYVVEMSMFTWLILNR